MDVYFEEPEYMRWLVANAAQNQLKPSETDRFIARVGQCEHYLTTYFVEKKPEPVALPAVPIFNICSFNSLRSDRSLFFWGLQQLQIMKL